MKDLIERQRVSDLFDAWEAAELDHHIPKILRDRLKVIPPAQPERKTGVWLIYKFGSDAQCSECKTFFSDVYDMENSDNYCRHCGAKMEGLRRVKNERSD